MAGTVMNSTSHRRHLANGDWFYLQMKTEHVEYDIIAQ